MSLFLTDEKPAAIHHKNTTSSQTFPVQKSYQSPANIPESPFGRKRKGEIQDKSEKIKNNASDIIQYCKYNQLILVIHILWRIFCL